jgi:outer membrane biosynthesis protein TonB
VDSKALYLTLDNGLERGLAPLMLLSMLLHAAAIAGAALLPAIIGAAPAHQPPEVMMVRLMGGLEPAAPAAPPAPVNPDVKGPDVVELPRTDLIIPQPTPLERMITPVVPTEVIPIAERPPDTAPVPAPEKAPEPPPRVTLPDKVPEPQPKPPTPRRRAPNNDAAINRSIEEISRRVAAERADEQINQAIGNIAATRGRGTGTSSRPDGGSTEGRVVDPAWQAYYFEIREIVRSNWIRPPMAMSPDLISTWTIIIQPDGRISGRRLTRSSGVAEFDQSVEQAIVRSRLPRLPMELPTVTDNPSFMFQYNYLDSAG